LATVFSSTNKDKKRRPRRRRKSLGIFILMGLFVSPAALFFFLPGYRGNCVSQLHNNRVRWNNIMLTGFSLILSRAIVYDIVVSLDRCLEKKQNPKICGAAAAAGKEYVHTLTGGGNESTTTT
jgi:hypothetical protein